MTHPLAWGGWLLTTLAALSLTRNPLYLTLILLSLALVSAAAHSSASGPMPPVSPLRLTLLVVPIAALFNAAFSHTGFTVLFRIPETIPIIGGRITLEALTFGALNGLVIGGFFAAFTVLNAVLPIRSLIRLVPRAFYPVALVISIAVTFVPTTLRQFQQIREAQAIRGHRVRRIRDWLPLFMPLLVGGLERALQLAEAMTARGFAGGDNQGRQAVYQTALVGGLAAVLAGWLLRLAWGWELPGAGLMLAGAGAVIGVVASAGRRTRHTVYRVERWSRRDALILAGAAMLLVVWLAPLPGIDRQSLAFTPYPRLQPPEFDALVGAAILGLAVPAMVIADNPIIDSRKSQG